MGNKIIIPTGYMGSGSSAITDLLSEIEGFDVNNGSFEYVLLHCPDGIFDLEDKLLIGNTAMRSDEALHRFHECAKMLYKRKNYWISMYNKRVSKDFLKYSEQLIEDLTTVSFIDKVWYFQQNPDTASMQLIHYLSRFLSKVSKRKIKIKEPLKYNKMRLAFPANEEFYSCVKSYLKKIYNELGYDKHNLVLDQLVLPHNLFRIDNYFDENARFIVVQRDPRDVFILNKYFWSKINGAVPYPTDVNMFCEMYKKMRKAEKKVKDSRILKINFEDLIYQYDSVVENIYEFIGVSASEHRNKFKFFNPEISINNTQLFVLNEYKEEADVIKDKLKEYIYDFPYINKSDSSKCF